MTDKKVYDKNVCPAGIRNTMGVRTVLLKIPPIRWLAALTRGMRKRTHDSWQSHRPAPSTEELAKHYSSEEYLAHKRDRFELREEYIALLRQTIGEGKKVADFGCARGLVTREIQKFSKEIFGIDFSPAFIEEAKKNLGEEFVLQADLCNLPDSVPKDFDAIWCSEVIEHVRNPEKLFQSAHGILKENGRFIVTFPPGDFTGRNPNWDNIDKHLWCFTKDGLAKIASKWFDVENFIPYDDAAGQVLTFKKKTNS